MTVPKNFFKNIVIDENGCWNRTKNNRGDGYTRVHFNDKKIYAHRFIYEYYYGSITEGKPIDHLCRNPKCVNPNHLEQVEIKVNLNRGINSRRERKSCLNGHEYNEKNTYYYRNYRRCKICLKQQIRKYRYKKKLLIVL